MGKIIHICKLCKRATGTIPQEDILFFEDYWICQKCHQKEKEEWERLLEATIECTD